MIKRKKVNAESLANLMHYWMDNPESILTELISMKELLEDYKNILVF
jgi:hypothetical protein